MAERAIAAPEPSIRFQSYSAAILRFVWLASLIALAGVVLYTPERGWDVGTYRAAMEALRHGLDPYAAGLARQYAERAGGRIAATYVYPPATLFVLHLLNLAPAWLAGMLYWTVYGAGFAGQLWAATRCFRPEDHRVMRYAVPLAVFFPGLMTGDTILSGNVACIIYGCAFAAAVPGWKRNDWRWFYAAVLLGAGLKAPLLTLLAIPLFAGRRQFRAAIAVGAASLGLLAVQAWIWPIQFREFLTSVNLQFKFNQDFGQSPAGILSAELYRRGLPYSPENIVVFAAYAGVLFIVLWRFSRLYRDGRISSESWIPVLLVSTLLLNPRIMKYDVLPLALPMALIVVRSVKSLSKAGVAVALAVLFLIVADLCGVSPSRLEDVRNMLVLVSVAALGLYSLALESRRQPSEFLSQWLMPL